MMESRLLQLLCQSFCLSQHQLCRSFLLVGWVIVLPEKSSHNGSHLARTVSLILQSIAALRGNLSASSLAIYVSHGITLIRFAANCYPRIAVNDAVLDIIRLRHQISSA